jgi:hypothetical protein
MKDECQKIGVFPLRNGRINGRLLSIRHKDQPLDPPYRLYCTDENCRLRVLDPVDLLSFFSYIKERLEKDGGDGRIYKRVLETQDFLRRMLAALNELPANRIEQFEAESYFSFGDDRFLLISLPISDLETEIMLEHGFLQAIYGDEVAIEVVWTLVEWLLKHHDINVEGGSLKEPELAAAFLRRLQKNHGIVQSLTNSHQQFPVTGSVDGTSTDLKGGLDGAIGLGLTSEGIKQPSTMGDGDQAVPDTASTIYSLPLTKVREWVELSIQLYEQDHKRLKAGHYSGIPLKYVTAARTKLEINLPKGQLDGAKRGIRSKATTFLKRRPKRK